MNARTAENLCHCHRQNENGRDNPRIQKAVRFAEQHGELRAKLEQQRHFDRHIAAEVRAITPPPTLPAVLSTFQPQDGDTHGSIRSILKQPAILAVAIGLFVLVGLFIRERVRLMDSFPGHEAVARMIVTTDEMSGIELEPVNTQAGKLGDWFFLKYGLEHYDPPREFAHLETAGCRVFKQDGFPVAQIAVSAGRHHVWFYMFRAEDFGVRLDGEDWRIFTEEAWVGAVREKGGSCVMIAFVGNRGDMEGFLKDEAVTKPPPVPATDAE